MTVQLFHGDCLDILPTLAAGSVNAVVTDPPFGIDFKYNTHDDSPEEYDVLINKFVEQSNRICTDGFIFVWQAMLQCKNWHKWFKDDYRIFAGLKNFVQFRPTPVQFSFDPVIFWKNGKPDLNPVAGMRDYHMGNTAKYVAEKSNGHPCPRPLNTVSYIVAMVTKQTGTILDPFMGSGTTGVAAVKLGRNFIGIEKDEKYFAIAQRRIAQAEAQPALLEIP